MEDATAKIKTAEWSIEVKSCAISLANRLPGAGTQPKAVGSRHGVCAGQRRGWPAGWSTRSHAAKMKMNECSLLMTKAHSGLTGCSIEFPPALLAATF